MSVEKQQELLRLMEALSDRAWTCANPVDKNLMIQALGHLVDDQACVSRRKEWQEKRY